MVSEQDAGCEQIVGRREKSWCSRLLIVECCSSSMMRREDAGLWSLYSKGGSKAWDSRVIF